ncbi:MAG: TetM/TetW/TetO/TetS family tetracycline resistance ribosomal protection protein [Clostridia bacterium]|nr:TetM/TetW/TetO/TetS family tetracycline resistance ribosomal protection protein [Clostridia bacterium]
MKKTIGIFAHVDAGKTTFSEQLLYHHEIIRKKGRVDTKDAFLDGHEIEKRRGITIFSEQAYFQYESDLYYLIDTPGHMDFSAEMERTIKIMDYAIILVSGIDGVQSHTETVYELLKKVGIPIFFFVNKLDVSHADYPLALKSIQDMSPCAVDFMEDYYESASEHDEMLMHLFFENKFNEDFHKRLKEVILSQKIMPVFGGSALQDQNISEFFKKFHGLTTTKYSDGELSGFVYKVRYDSKNLKQCFIKITEGQLKVRDYILEDKITEIRRYQGFKYESIQEAHAGDVVAIIGSQMKVGDVFGKTSSYHYEMMPTMASKVFMNDKIPLQELYKTLLILEEEDPALQVLFVEDQKELQISIMGEIQLEILKEVIQNRFSMDVSFLPPTVIYKETIGNTIIGYGHFEPLKHYAEVHLKLEPNDKGGFIFESACSTDDLNYGQQNLVKHHLFEKPHRGILTGSHLTDIKITLLRGRSHNKHTSGGDFREATIRALRQGLEQADNQLLEPYYEMVITVPLSEMGKVLQDVQVLKGICVEQKDNHDKVKLKIEGPVSTFHDYPKTLLSQTHGLGRIRMKVIGYKPCHNTQEVIEAIGYDKITDTAYPSSSIFCSKGKGYSVSWQEAKDHMHCL